MDVPFLHTEGAPLRHYPVYPLTVARAWWITGHSSLKEMTAPRRSHFLWGEVID
jgi:hypothetical protein